MNQYRLQRGVDNYGQGRRPWVIEPGCCLLFTDGEGMGKGGGGNASPQQQQQQHQLHLTCPPNDLTREPFRWDQRFFPLVIQPGGAPPSGGQQPAVAVASASHPPLSLLRALTDATGGFYSSTDSLMGLNVRVDHILHKLERAGPVVAFAPADAADHPQPQLQPELQQQQQQQQPEPPPQQQSDGQNLQEQPQQSQQQPQQPPQDAQGQPPVPSDGQGQQQPPGAAKQASDSTTKGAAGAPSAAVRAVLVLGPESAGNVWPIPEAFWLERALEHLPKRDAQPTLLYRRLSPDSHDPALTSIAVRGGVLGGAAAAAVTHDRS